MNLIFNLTLKYIKRRFHMSILFAYTPRMAGREGGSGLSVLSEGGQNFFYLFCVCVGGGIRFSTSPSVKKNNRHLSY